MVAERVAAPAVPGSTRVSTPPALITVTEKSGTGGEGRWGRGAFAADYDGDGWTDILVTNFGANRLYRNRSDGTFVNVAR